MGSAVKVRDDYSAVELRRLARVAKDVRQSSRLLAIAQIAFGVGEELHPAACAAKMKVVSRMGSMVRRPLRIDGHPTNRILCLGR